MTSAGIGKRSRLLASGSCWASLQRPSGEGGRGSGEHATCPPYPAPGHLPRGEAKDQRRPLRKGHTKYLQ